MESIALSLKVTSVTFTDTNNIVQFDLDIDATEFNSIRSAVDAVTGRYFLAGVIGFSKWDNLQVWPITSVSATTQTIYVEVEQASHVANDETSLNAYAHVLYRTDFDANIDDIYSDLKAGNDITILIEIDHFDLVLQEQGTWRVSNYPFITLPTDNPPGVSFYDAILSGGLSYETSVSVPESTDSDFFFGSSQNEGSLEIDNSSGSRDDWFLKNSVEAQEVRVFIAPRSEKSFDNFAQFKKYIALSIKVPSSEKIKIELRSQDFTLDIPLQTSRTIREDGSEGDLIPVVYGQVFHTEPPQVPASLLDSETYQLTLQVGEGHIYGIESVMDNGDPLVDGLDYDVFTDAEKSYCLIGIVSPPAGRLTVQIGSFGGVLPDDYICYPSDIIKHVLLNFTDLTENNLDLVSFATHKLINNVLVGYYVSEDVTVNAFLDQILKDCGSVKYWTNEGKLRIVHIPILAYPSFFHTNFGQISEIDFNNITFDKITVQEILPPVHSIIIGFSKNYAVMADGDFAGSVDTLTREIFSDEFYFKLSSMTKIGFGLNLVEITSRQDLGLDYVIIDFDFSNENARIGFENANIQAGDFLTIYNVSKQANHGIFEIIGIEYSYPTTMKFTIVIVGSSSLENDETPALGFGKITMSESEAARPGYPSAIRVDTLDTGLGRLRAAAVMLQRLKAIFTMPSILIDVELSNIAGHISVGNVLKINNNPNNYLNLLNKYGVVMSESLSFVDNTQKITLWYRL
jgi:hypothetical protein